jgi:hypothetical protein
VLAADPRVADADALRGPVDVAPTQAEVAGDELAHDLLDPRASPQGQLDFDGDLVSVEDDQPIGPMPPPTVGLGGDFAVKLALADPRRAGMPRRDVQPHVGGCPFTAPPGTVRKLP